MTTFPLRYCYTARAISIPHRLKAIYDLCRFSNGALERPVEPRRTILMVKGIKINGKDFKQGNQVQYLPMTRRRLDWEHTPKAFATINMFYVFGHGTHNQSVYVEGSLLRPYFGPPAKGAVTGVLDRSTALHLVDKVDITEASQDGFDRVPSGETVMFHIDSITHRVKLVPAPVKQFENLLCVVNMWKCL